MVSINDFIREIKMIHTCLGRPSLQNATSFRINPVNDIIYHMPLFIFVTFKGSPQKYCLIRSWQLAFSYWRL